MDSFGKVLGNKQVLIIGGALGLVLLLMPKSAAAPVAASNSVASPVPTSASSGVAPVDYTPLDLQFSSGLMSGLLGATTDQNANAFNYEIANRTIDGNIAMAKISAKVAEQTSAYSMFANIATGQNSVKQDLITANAGVVNSAITSNAAYGTEVAANNARAVNAIAQGNATAEQAKQAAWAAAQVAKQSFLSKIAGALGSVAGVATAVATGGASMAPSLFAGLPINAGSNVYGGTLTLPASIGANG